MVLSRTGSFLKLSRRCSFHGHRRVRLSRNHAQPPLRSPLRILPERPLGASDSRRSRSSSHRVPIGPVSNMYVRVCVYGCAHVCLVMRVVDVCVCLYRRAPRS
ncbi:hypothetical protein NDU88_007165 [Pleurodeles waltl]|uniref:Uncharacterized protein n=1 Tax=Pleurodeles waltl TaxID=8319 RepID=A0AAV7TZW1_PLEWA|nr:hypothetical protein NDU88_007165 [Pleurodeles waltl]